MSIWTSRAYQLENGLHSNGILLPPELGPFTDGFDSWGRPQFVNTETASHFFKNNLLAFDRAFLYEEQKAHPLFAFQRLMMQEAYRRQFLWIQMMRGGSKSYTIARFMLDYALMHEDVPTVITAPTFRQALLVFDYALDIIKRCARNENTSIRLQDELASDPVRNTTESMIRLRNGSSIRALPMGNGEKIRGVRGGLLVVDEFYQINEEMYQLHIKPFVGVKQGGQPSKIIHITTSAYQDCFAWKRLQQIAQEVREGNPAYGILDITLDDIKDSGFPLDMGMVEDSRKHDAPIVHQMTYYNLWPESSARWFEQKYIDLAQNSAHGVHIRHKPNPAYRYFVVVDLAASEHGDHTTVLVFEEHLDNEEPDLHCVWGYEAQGLDGGERAWLVHQMYETWNPEFIIYDAHAAIGKDLASELRKREIFVKGTLHKVTPLVHHDQFNLQGHYVLIPIAVKDTAIRLALEGPRGGVEIRSEADLKERLMTKTRDILIAGHLLGPASANEGDPDHPDEVVPYNGSDIEILDVIRDAYTQLGKIGLEKDKNGEQLRSDDGKLLFTKTQGLDGAMCLVYASVGYLRLAARFETQRATTRQTPIGEVDPQYEVQRSMERRQSITF